MGLTSSIDHARHEILATAEGQISYEEIRRHLEEERAAGGLAYAELIDARKAVPDVSSEDVRRIVEILNALGHGGPLGPTAVVVATDVAYGMVRMLQILVERVCVIQPFREYAAAVQWLREVGEGASSSGHPTAAGPVLPGTA